DCGGWTTRGRVCECAKFEPNPERYNFESCALFGGRPCSSDCGIAGCTAKTSKMVIGCISSTYLNPASNMALDGWSKASSLAAVDGITWRIDPPQLGNGGVCVGRISPMLWTRLKAQAPMLHVRVIALLV